MKPLHLAVSLLLAIAVAGCQNSSGVGGVETGEPRAGISTDVIVPSAVDGEDISFTVHEPTNFVEGQRYPLILEGHGYGGSKTNAASRPASGGTGTFARLLDAGYGAVSYTHLTLPTIYSV